MGSRKNNYNANLAFVREIYKRRNILFGSTDGLNHNEANLAKEKAWEEVKEAISQLGHQKFKNKDWRQLRANEWQQVRRSAMAKRYLNDLSGAKNPLNELDRLVLEIVGQEEQNGEEGNILEKHPLNLLNFTHKDDQVRAVSEIFTIIIILTVHLLFRINLQLSCPPFPKPRILPWTSSQLSSLSWTLPQSSRSPRLQPTKNLETDM